MNITIVEALTALDEFARLEPDWDGNGALPSDAVARDAARSLLSRPGMPEPWIVTPIPNGGIFIEWLPHGRTLSVDISPGPAYGYLASWRRVGRATRYEEAHDVPLDTVLTLIAQMMVEA